MNNSLHFTYLINTSVDDCKTTLECALRHKPQEALLAATSALDELNRRDKNGQVSRKKALQTIINKANKLIAKNGKAQS